MPLSLVAYVLVPIILGHSYIIPENFLGLFKLLIISFFIVVLSRWFIYFVIGSFLKGTAEDGILKKLFKRIPGVFISAAEGVILVAAIFWSLDFLDCLMANKLTTFYQSLFRNPVYNFVNTVNPIYDVKGSKDLKIVLSALGSREFLEKLFETEAFRKFDTISTVRKMISDSSFQELLKSEKTRELLTHPFIIEFLKDKEVYQNVTSENFIRECRRVLPGYHIKLIDDRKGLFSDIHLNFNFDSVTGAEKISSNGFISDTKVILKNGSFFEGQLVKQDEKGVLLLLKEGELLIKKDEILHILDVKANSP